MLKLLKNLISWKGIRIKMDNNKKSFGNTYAFAHGDPVNGGDPGMTYRMWLIGRLASGVLSATPENQKRNAVSIIQCADAIITELDKEEGFINETEITEIYNKQIDSPF